MISALDQDQLLRIRQRGNQRLQLRSRAELVTRSADEQLWLIAGLQKFIGVNTRFFRICSHGSDWNSQANRSADTRIGAGSAQSDRGTERESGENQRQVQLRVEPVERGADVVDFPDAVIMFSLAQSSSAEVEAQHGKSETAQSLHRVEDDFVVQRSSEQRMRMANYSGMRRVLSAGVEQGFEASSGTFEEEGTDGLVRWDHISRLHKTGGGLPTPLESMANRV